jgi:hypothetical protein
LQYRITACFQDLQALVPAKRGRRRDSDDRSALTQQRQHAFCHQSHAEVVHLQHIGGRRRTGDASDIGEHVPPGAELAEHRADARRIAQVALQMVGSGRLVLADVDREDVITAVVEVCRDGRTDA